MRQGAHGSQNGLGGRFQVARSWVSESHDVGWVAGHVYNVAALLRLAAVIFCVGELNDQLVRLDFDPDDMSLDEDCILNLSGRVEVPPNRICNESFNLVSRNPADGPGLFGSGPAAGPKRCSTGT